MKYLFLILFSGFIFSLHSQIDCGYIIFENIGTWNIDENNNDSLDYKLCDVLLCGDYKKDVSFLIDDDTYNFNKLGVVFDSYKKKELNSIYNLISSSSNTLKEVKDSIYSTIGLSIMERYLPTGSMQIRMYNTKGKFILGFSTLSLLNTYVWIRDIIHKTPQYDNIVVKDMEIILSSFFESILKNCVK